MVTDLQTTAHHLLLAASWPDLEQIFVDADGMAVEQSSLLPQQRPSQLFAEDWAQLLSGVEIDPSTSQAGDLSLLMAHAVAGSHLDDADLDVPDRIVVAHFPKLTLYEFCLEKAPFPEFLKVFEELARTEF